VHFNAYAVGASLGAGSRCAAGSLFRSGGMSEVRAAIFRGGTVIEQVELEGSMPQHGDAAFIWVEVLNPLDRDFSVLQERFQLHGLAVKDSMCPMQAPKLDVYDDQIFVVLKIARLIEDRINYAEVDAFVSSCHIITVRHDKDVEYVDSQRRLRSAPRATKPDFILYSILDYVANAYFPVVQMIEGEVLAMEQRLVDAFLDREEITRLFRLRRESIQFQHVLTRMSDVCGKLANLEVPCIRAELRPYFRDVHDQLARLDGMIGGLLDVIRAVFEASTLLEQQRQATSTRQLAAWAAIVGAPTAIASIYSMNVPHLAGLYTPYGYVAVVVVTVSSCVALYVRFKKLGWL
jgi:magnesium transporter